VVLPKPEGVADVLRAQQMINVAAEKAGRPNLPLHVLIETHGALHEAWEIAALPQVECLSFGIMDFVSSHYGAIPGAAMRTPGQFTHPLIVRAKLEMVAACHAHHKVPSHNVTTDIKDSAVVANDATRAAGEFGFTRMWSIHPDQIKPIVKAFTPRVSEVNEATNILLEAMAADWGPIAQHGRLHDRASYRYYWTVLQRAKLAGLALPDAAAAIVNQPESI
jgi:citrate lyase subunit beta/citryl-CoA lyase